VEAEGNGEGSGLAFPFAASLPLYTPLFSPADERRCTPRLFLSGGRKNWFYRRVLYVTVCCTDEIVAPRYLFVLRVRLTSHGPAEPSNHEGETSGCVEKTRNEVERFMVCTLLLAPQSVLPVPSIHPSSLRFHNPFALPRATGRVLPSRPARLSYTPSPPHPPRYPRHASPLEPNSQRRAALTLVRICR
jgi:hypothetical protein